MDTFDQYDFQKGEVVLVDKPLTWTSFDVVNKLRYPLSRRFGIKRFKVGHAGTLDPLATGLLVICTGKMTKQIEGFLGDEKEYTGIIQLGSTTPSFDLETEIDATFETGHITQDLVDQIKPQFEGEQDQTPPIFSAKRVNGKRAYLSAREGKKIEMKSNRITITDIELKLENDQIHFVVSCSKGTYIRSLANDIGKALKSGAHLIELRRTRSGNFKIENAKSVEEWMEIVSPNESS